MAAKKKAVKASAPVQSFEELVKEKQAAGLTKEQAESVAKRQLARDQESESDESGAEETNPPAA